MTPEEITNYWLTVGVIASMLFAALGFLSGYVTGYHNAIEDRDDACPYPVEEIFVEDTPPTRHSSLAPRHSAGGSII